ncbi:MAG: transglutaminase family protein [Thermodesulfobacteriota bacterium]
MHNKNNYLFVLPFLVFAVSMLVPAAGLAKARSGEVNFRVTIDAPRDNTDTRLWLPYPVSDGAQRIEDVRIEGNQTYHGVYRDPATGNMALYAEWTRPAAERRLVLSFRATAAERVRKDFSAPETSLPVEVEDYLKPTRFIPVDGRVREIADRITRGRRTVLERAMAVYDWVVENTYRDPTVRGCGTGEVEVLLARKGGVGGKCADISSVFVALARASGVPAREVFGLRLGDADRVDITGGHHCWAEFYRPGLGWVPVDPADVRKAMLVKGLGLEEAEPYREYFFGAVDGRRIVLGRGGRALYLSPPQKDGPLNYFMYPYAEVDGRALGWLAEQGRLKYRVTFKAADRETGP